MNKKILILGSRGLVGSSVYKTLKSSEMIGEVINSSRKDTNLFDFKQTNNLISTVRPNVIINAAARVGGIYANNTKRTEFILENLKINLNLLESCIPYPEIKIINLGSSCIYPLDAENPIKEDYFMGGKLEPTNSPYAMAKLTAIEMSHAMTKQYGHEIINLMPTNLYGPNDNFSLTESHVIPGLIHRMHISKEKKHDEFLIWGTGTPLREFLYVDDLADCIRFLIDKKVEKSLINVGSGEEVSILDLAQLIKKIISFDGSLKFDNSKPDGNPRKLIDSTLINSLGWKSKTKLEDGIELTYQWFLKNLANKRG
jgi:GDP-L-fucose synthase